MMIEKLNQTTRRYTGKPPITLPRKFGIMSTLGLNHPCRYYLYLQAKAVVTVRAL